MKYKFTLILFALTIGFNCNGTVLNSSVDQNEKQLELEIIPSNEVAISWDSNVYQHNSEWTTLLDTTAADSLASLLERSGLLIEDMWFPNENTECLILLMAGSQIIIKLNKPDSLVYKFGFRNNDGGFPIGCFDYWRHYKYINN